MSQSIQDYMDSFFRNMEITDVIALEDIPILNINGILQQPSAIHFFKSDSGIPPTSINSYDKDFDAIFWIFDTFFVLELGAKTKDSKLFYLAQLIGYNDVNEKEPMKYRIDSMKLMLKIQGLKSSASEPCMAMVIFREASIFFQQNSEYCMNIFKKKYVA